MHVVEATAIMTNNPPVGRGDVSPCLPGWIKTICDAFQRGEGYTLSHSAVSALGHTLIGSRVRAERLVLERDAAMYRVIELEKEIEKLTEASHGAETKAKAIEKSVLPERSRE